MKAGWKVLAAAAWATVLAGCQSVRIEPGSKPHVPPVGGEAEETQIVRSAIPVAVKDISSPASGFTADVAELARGRLAAAGFAVVTAEAPYIEVRLNTHVAPFDTLGNYEVYEGQCGVGVVRVADGRLLASELVSVKSDRVLEAGRALIDARRKIGAEAAATAARACTEKTTGVESSILVLRRMPTAGAENLAANLRRTRGVYSCIRIPGETDGIQYRLVYDAKAFPDGIQQAVRRAR